MKFHEALLLVVVLILGFLAADAMGWIPRPVVQQAAVPQVIFVPVQATPAGVSPDVLFPTMTTAIAPVPVETWAGAEVTAVALPVGATAVPAVPIAGESCKETQNCPANKGK